MPVEPALHYQITGSFGEFGDFDDFTGGELDINVTDYVAGGRRSAQKLQGTYAITDIVLMRAYVPQRDAALVDWANRSKDGLETARTATKRVTNQQGVVIDSRVYPNCKAKNIKIPDGKAGDNTVAQITITLAVEQFV